ncbi:MAG: hypothetical protein JJE36_01465 [Coriobacteriia bacterium]|nr:hypothetical protein [Coriobacteriia bacterium]
MDSGNELEVQDYPGDAESASDDKLAKKSARKGFFKKNRAWLIPVIVILLALGGKPCSMLV